MTNLEMMKQRISQTTLDKLAWFLSAYTSECTAEIAEERNCRNKNIDIFAPRTKPICLDCWLEQLRKQDPEAKTSVFERIRRDLSHASLEKVAEWFGEESNFCPPDADCPIRENEEDDFPDDLCFNCKRAWLEQEADPAFWEHPERRRE